MENIDLYTYWKKPFSRGKNFSIRPLDEPGREKYYSKESHNYHFLKKTDPFVFKSLLGIDYNTLIRQQKEDIQTLKNFKSATNIHTLPKSKKENIESAIHKSNYISTENKKNDLTDKDELEHNNRYNTIGVEDSSNISRKMRNFKSQKYFRPYHKERNFKDIYGYENAPSSGSKSDQFLTLINSIKSRSLNKDNTRYQRKYDGYTFYEIPLIDFNKKGKNKYLDSRFEQTIKCIKNEGGLHSMNDEELKQNLYNQTSRVFLKKYHLPDLFKIINTKQLIRKQKIGLSKEMGEKYNPFSLLPPSKNRTKRNYLGDLFKH